MILHDKLSKPRYIFRYALLVVLAFSLLFTATVIYFRIETRIDIRNIEPISPVLFFIDSSIYMMKAKFKEPDEKFATAKRLCAYSFFSPIYGKHCLHLMIDLSEDGYAPAQTFQANLIMRTAKTHADFLEAMVLYRQAAAQDYEPAKLKLVLLEPVE